MANVVSPLLSCPHCGCPVLRGRTDAGTRLLVETDSRTWIAIWLEGTPEPRLVPSQGYVEHDCLMAGAEELATS